MKRMITSWLTALAAGLRAFFQKIKQLFRAKTPKPGNSGIRASGGTPLDKDEFYDEYLRMLGKWNDIIVKLGLHERISATHKYVYEMGRRDGSLGVVLKNLNDMMQAIAQDTFQHISVILKGKLAATETELKMAGTGKESAGKSHQREQSYLEYLKFQFRFFPRSHSLLLFVIYFITAIALLIADIPLALKLIQKGFNLEGGSETESFPYLFADPSQFWHIISVNWETVVTAMGIALCTIYIKIFYDEFVGTPYANRHTTFKQFREENGIENKDDIRRIKSENRIKTAAKILLFAITIVSIVLLALFRLENAESIIVEGRFSGPAFVAITLLFPLVSGICLSYALSNIQNIKRLRRTKGDCETSRKESEKAEKNYTALEKEYHDLQAASNRLADEAQCVGEYQRYFAAFYERGYAIGRMQPEKYTHGEDFFSKVMEWRNLAISRKITSHLGNLN
jgi:hypothetical protein